MSVVVVRYNAGNVRSIANALERIGVTYLITDDAAELLAADRVIFPGVGAAQSAMEHLRRTGLDTLLRQLSQPVLGVCLGMQLLSDGSDEGNSECLSVIPGRATRFQVAEKIPHMGWSKVKCLDHPVFKGIAEDSFFYFVHSYRLGVSEDTVAQCNYGESFSAAVARRNFVGVQFHPEKSGANGERLLRNFMEWKV